MNLKLKAAAITLGVAATGLITGFVLSQLPAWASGVLVLVFALGIIYNLALARLKFEEAVSEIGKKYEK